MLRNYLLSSAAFAPADSAGGAPAEDEADTGSVLDDAPRDEHGRFTERTVDEMAEDGGIELFDPEQDTGAALADGGTPARRTAPALAADTEVEDPYAENEARRETEHRQRMADIDRSRIEGEAREISRAYSTQVSERDTLIAQRTKAERDREAINTRLDGLLIPPTALPAQINAIQQNREQLSRQRERINEFLTSSAATVSRQEQDIGRLEQAYNGKDNEYRTVATRLQTTSHPGGAPAEKFMRRNSSWLGQKTEADKARYGEVYLMSQDLARGAGGMTAIPSNTDEHFNKIQELAAARWPHLNIGKAVGAKPAATRGGRPVPKTTASSGSGTTPRRSGTDKGGKLPRLSATIAEQWDIQGVLDRVAKKKGLKERPNALTEMSRNYKENKAVRKARAKEFIDAATRED